MFKFLKKKDKPDNKPIEKKNIKTKHLKPSRNKSRSDKIVKKSLFSKVANLFRSGYDTKEIEKLLLESDIDFATVKSIIETINFSNFNWQNQLKEYFKKILKIKKLKLNQQKLNIIEIIGVNGVGKTTFISKLSNFYKGKGFKILLSAADTFRAAAIEQLKYWANKLSIDIVAQKSGADPAAVVFDSIDKAISKNYNLLIIDTAGRLQNKEQLMNQLKKIDKVILKKINDYDKINKSEQSREKEVEVFRLLVLDANIGKNSLKQLEIFNQFTKIDAFAITKLDSTAKGGIIFSIFNKYDIPIFAISFGEMIDNYMDSSDPDFKNKLINLI